MYQLKIYYDDGNGNKRWEDGVGNYETYDKALVACFRNALQKTQDLMSTSDGAAWFEVEDAFEVTEPYRNEVICQVLGADHHNHFFEAAVTRYDHAPYDRENDCDIRLVTGYLIVEV